MDKVSELFRETNKPYNVQGIVNMLQKYKIGKAAVEKALNSLVSKGELLEKEFGKTKIYFPSQEGLAQLDPQEKADQMAEIKQLTEDCRAQQERIAALKKEVAANKAQLSVKELRAKIEELQVKTTNLEGKLASFRTGATLISAEDVAKVEASFKRMLNEWSRRKRMFKEMFSEMSENLDGKQSDLFDAMGVETDEAIGEELSVYQKLLLQSKKPRN